MRRHKAKSAIQTGRNLPATRYKSYTPPEDREPAADELKPKSRSRRILWRLLLSLVLLFFIFIIGLAIWDARNISSASQKLFGNGSIFSLLKGGDLASDSNGRVNVLIVGYSADDPGHSGANLTDSIILLSMNPTNKTGYMLSVPRDLYVNIPSYGYSKVNAVYEYGGMALLEKVVSQDFGVKINNYALIDYGATRGIVDALGGITVNINSPDGRLYDPSKDYSTGGPLLDLSNGRHILNGQQALDFTRARGDDPQSIGFEGPQGSDFKRTADQRQVLAAIKAKLNWKLILNPRKNSQILSAISDNVKTDITATEARPVFSLFNSIPNSQLQSLNLRSLNGTNYLSGYITRDGQSALIPSAGLNDYSQIQTALSQLNL